MSGNTVLFTPTANANGADSFVYKICDNGTPQLCTSNITVSFTIIPVNDAPTVAVAGDATKTFDEDTPTNIALAQGADVDTGDVLSYVIVTSPTKGALASWPTPASAAGNVVNFLPTLNANGSDSFVYKICDNGTPQLCTSNITVSITITPVNDAPTVAVAGDTSKTFLEDNTATINLAQGADVDTGDVLTYVAVIAPQKGTLATYPALASVSGNTILFTPTANANGADSFVYKICDNGTPQLCTSNITVSMTITPVNDAPTVAVAGDTTKTFNEDTPTAITLAQGADVDTGDVLSYVTVTSPSKGSLASWPTPASASGNTVLFSPTQDANGSDSFVYKICDNGTPQLCTSNITASLTITPVNDAPTIAVAGDTTKTFNEDTPTNISLAKGADVDTGDVLSYVIVTSPSKGSLASWPTPASASGNTVLFSPTQDANGSDSFVYKICDNGTPQLCTADITVSISITPVNDAPTISTVSDTVFWVTDNPKTINFTIADVDNTLTCAGSMSKSSSNTSLLPVANIVFSGTAPNCTATFTPTTGIYGTSSVTLTVSDGSLTAATTFNFTVHSLPVLRCGDISLPPGGTYAFPCGAVDPDEGLTITINSESVSRCSGPTLSGGTISGTMGYNACVARVAVTATKAGRATSFTQDVAIAPIKFGTNYPVNAVFPLTNGDVVLGGGFTTINPDPAADIIAVNTTTAVRDTSCNFTNGFDAQVNAIASMPDGSFVVGGQFSQYHGTTANRIARVDCSGALVSSFATGTGFPTGSVNALVVSGTDIYVGGNFTSYNGTNAKNLVKLNTTGNLVSTFTAYQGTGLNGVVQAVALVGSNVYAGGLFTAYNGTTATRIAAFDSTGVLVSSFSTGTGFNNTVYSLAPSDNGIYVGGSFSTYNGSSATNFTKLDTTGAIIAGFSGTLMNTNDVMALVVTGTTAGNDEMVYAGGKFTSYKGTAAGSIAKINQSGVMQQSFGGSVGVAGGSPNAVNALAVSGNNLYAAGNFTQYKSTASDSLVKINHTTGTKDATFAVGTGFGNIGGGTGVLANALALSGNHLVVGGYFSGYQGTSANNITKFSSSGSVVSAFATGTGLAGYTPDNVYSLTSNGTNIYLAGYFQTYKGTSITSPIALDATTASVAAGFSVSTGFTGGAANRLLANGTDLYVGGGFTAYRSTTSNYIAKLDASTGLAAAGFAIGTGFSASTMAMALDSTNSILYVGGSFLSYQGTTTNRIAAISSADGHLINAFGTGFDNAVQALALNSAGTTLYAGGQFASYKGTTSINRIAAIDTSNGNLVSSFTSGVGTSGFGNNVTGLALDSANGVLYAIGAFTTYKGSTMNRITAISTTNGAVVSSFASGTGLSQTNPNAISMLGTELYVASGSNPSFNGLPNPNMVRIDTTANNSGTWLLSLANDAADGQISAADASNNLAVISHSYTGYDSANYAVVSASTTACSGAQSYTYSSLPLAGDAGFVSTNWYKICARFVFGADTYYRLSNAFYRQ